MLTWSIAITLAIPVLWWLWQLKQKLDLRREARRLSAALSVSHAVFQALDHLPQSLLSRDLRRGLVLLLHHHINVLKQVNPMHPHLTDLEQRMRTLNQIPSGMTPSRLRTKLERRYAAQALEELGRILKDAPKQNSLEQKVADLARAAAVFGSQHIAVESARQSCTDAENMRAYSSALNFAYKAQALCKSLPPMVGATLADAIASDIERLEAKCRTGTPA
jgi:hypothetical protein